MGEVRQTKDKVKKAAKKVVGEVGKGVSKAGKVVGNAPGGIIKATVAKPLAAAGEGVGGAIGGVSGGLGKLANNLLPAAQGLLGTYMNPTGYVDRKSDFTTPPVVQAPPSDGGYVPTSGSGFNFSSLIPVLIIGVVGMVLFFIIKRK